MRFLLSLEPMAEEKRRVALVTGGAVRVGRAIVERLAKAGFSVAFTYRSSESEALDLAEMIDGHAIRADLSDPESASATIFAAFKRISDRLDVLVNNASVFKRARLAETDLALMRETAAVNVQAPLLLCQEFATMLRASRGHIVNMCDLLGERPHPQYMIYCASKAALANLTMNLARELAPEVTVNGIAPGVVAWPEDEPQSERDNYLKRIPLARAGTPEDVANLVHFLATEGSYITGQIIRLDGGRSIT